MSAGTADLGTWDVAVIGAGPAGLFAAIRAAAGGARTVVLEKNRKPGVKILISGGTRCNVTHDADARGIVAAFGPPGRFLHSALARLDPPRLVELLDAEGVATKVEPGGKVFPTSDRALDVQRAIVGMAIRGGCRLQLGTAVVELRPTGDGFSLATSAGPIVARRVVLATGGQSYPGCGTTGDGYRLAAALGHTIVPPRPALVPLVIESDWVRALSGLTVGDVGVRVLTVGQEGRADVLASARGSFLFTHFGLSGPVVLDVSRAVSAAAEKRALRLECDFRPELPAAGLAAELQRLCRSEGGKHLRTILPAAAPARLAEALAASAGAALETRAAEWSNAGRQRFVAAVKQTRLPIAATLGFEKAEVTAGGAALDEVDSRTMQSKRAPGLYLAGEVLDLDGPIGGYNFQAAFSTGWLAGESAAG